MKIKSGFTLIEITVVLVIVGVLAAIALPSVFGWIKKSRSAEVFETLHDFNTQIYVCVLAHPGNEGTCASLIQGTSMQTGNVIIGWAIDGGSFYMDGPDPFNGSQNYSLLACSKDSFISIHAGIATYGDCAHISHATITNPPDTWTCIGNFAGMC